MTFDEKIREMLVERGLSENHAREIVVAAKTAEEFASMEDRWNDSINDYPEFLLTILWKNVRVLVLAWIDANLPEAWYRPMFVR